MYQLKTFKQGGIMANYQCNAACRHCLYACSPTREKTYMTKEIAKNTAAILKKHGCPGIHIGGGEPFLSFEDLQQMVEGLAEGGLKINYLETNANWATEQQSVAKKLDILYNLGVESFCISVDPFHMEYVPTDRALQLAQWCGYYGMGFFLWQQNFLDSIRNLPTNRTYSRAEIEEGLGKGYVRTTAKYYGVRYGGRALNIEEEFYKTYPLAEILDDTPCHDLLSTNHFHIDPHGMFIPPECTGLQLPLDKAVAGIEEGTYPAFEALLHSGVTALYALAKQYDYEEKKEYTSKCALCFDIRYHLAKIGSFAELNLEHYQASREYY